MRNKYVCETCWPSVETVSCFRYHGCTGIATCASSHGHGHAHFFPARTAHCKHVFPHPAAEQPHVRIWKTIITRRRSTLVPVLSPGAVFGAGCSMAWSLQHHKGRLQETRLLEREEGARAGSVLICIQLCWTGLLWGKTHLQAPLGALSSGCDTGSRAG